METWWHVWNIPFTELTDVNLANVKRITIGFGNGTHGSTSVVYFDDIRLYTEYPPRQHTTKIAYNGVPYRLMEEFWHVWNIPFTELNDVNLASVARITIGFGDGNAPYSNTGTGTVYFDDIILGQGNAEDPFYDGSVYLDEDPFVTSYLGLWPLYLKPDCPLIGAGAGYIDEYPYLIGKTTGYYPDTNMVNIGFHYPNWYYVNDGSGSADLDYSMTADLKDFAILADNWLQSTSRVADLDGSGFVDYLDLALFAEGWQRKEAMYVAGYSFGMHQPVDFNNVSGNISIWPENIPPDAREVFIYVDDTLVGNWVRGISEWAGFFESDKFANGQHTIRLVSINLNDSVTNYQSINANFNNIIYKVPSNSDGFYPLEDYHYSGFHDGWSLTATLTNCFDDVLWSGSYSGNYVDINIPGSAFGTFQTANLSITDGASSIGLFLLITLKPEDFSGGESAASQDSSGMIELESSDPPHTPERAVDATAARFLILLPNEDLANTQANLIQDIEQSCIQKNVTYAVVKGNLNNIDYWERIVKCRKDLFYGGHGSSHVSGRLPDGTRCTVQRTSLKIYKSVPNPDGSYDGETVNAYSYTTQTVGDAELLPNNQDVLGVDLGYLHLTDGGVNEDNIRIGWFNTCNSAGYTDADGGLHTTGDLAGAFGFLSLKAQERHDSLFIGWRKPVTNTEYVNAFGYAITGQRMIWDTRTGMGTYRNLGQSIESTDQSDLRVREALWGEDKCRVEDPSGHGSSEDNNLVGLGHGSPEQFYLNLWW